MIGHHSIMTAGFASSIGQGSVVTRRMPAFAAALVGLIASTLAPRATAAPACSVTITQAPDDVRAIVERWLADDPSCGAPLEVQIEARGDGLYLLARDARGQVRERVVPSADDAGVLIASWAADDAPARAPDEAVALHAPALAPPTDTLSVTARPVDAPTGPPRWLTVGGLTGISPLNRATEYGVRGTADIATWHGWTIGAAASIDRAHAEADEDAAGRDLVYTNAKLLVTVSRSIHAGRFHLRGSLGVGGMYLVGHDTPLVIDPTGTAQMTTVNGILPIVELSVMAGYQLGRWAIEGGPIATVYASTSDHDPELDVVHIPGDLILFAGISHTM